MSTTDALLSEVDLEMATVRKTLERIPEDKLAWKPHDKSTSLGRLAAHLAEIPTIGTRILQTDSFDVASRPQGQKPVVAESQQHVLEIFDKNIAQLREAIRATSDADWQKQWKFLIGPKVLYDGPRVGAIRLFMIKHMVHHRAQLGVYLRINDVPVPSVYGPSADESI